jgi:hypothetical protein
MQTYSATIIGLASATSPTDIFTITGSSTKTIRVTRIELSATQTTVGYVNVVLLKRSGADTGGASTQPTIVPHDSNNTGATAIINAWTSNPTTGALVGNIRSSRIFVSTATGGPTATENSLIWDFGTRPGQAIVLRGTAQVLAVNLNGTTVSGGAFNISMEWTEE